MDRTYPIAIFKDDDNPTYGVIVPDVPGCYPCGDSIAEAIEDSKSAIVAHIEFMHDTGRTVDFDNIRPIEELRKLEEYQDAICWALVSIKDTDISDKQVRFNVSWPEHLLNRVDSYANAHHETRSGFLAKAAIEMITR